MREKLVGKTIESVKYDDESENNDDRVYAAIYMKFTDGSVLTIKEHGYNGEMVLKLLPKEVTDD